MPPVGEAARVQCLERRLARAARARLLGSAPSVQPTYVRLLGVAASGWLHRSSSTPTQQQITLQPHM